jgi:hypothetical protein
MQRVHGTSEPHACFDVKTLPPWFMPGTTTCQILQLHHVDGALSHTVLAHAFLASVPFPTQTESPGAHVCRSLRDVVPPSQRGLMGDVSVCRCADASSRSMPPTCPRERIPSYTCRCSFRPRILTSTCTLPSRKSDSLTKSRWRRRLQHDTCSNAF